MPVEAAQPERIRVEGLTRHFTKTKGIVFKRVTGAVKAVDGVSFSVGRGETLSLVGESGCGKSTLGRMLVRLIEPTAGSIRLEGTEITGLGEQAFAPYRSRMQFIFQDPMSSLNPRRTVADIVTDPLVIQGEAAEKRRERLAELLTLVGLDWRHRNRYPHEFSGGQRQRIGIARALATRPGFIVCDEAVSALDVSVQAQIVNLLKRLQEETGVSFLFVAHDLSIVRHISHRVAVMYLGRIVELGDRDTVYGSPAHPYTRALLAAAPVPHPRGRAERARPRLVPGEIPSPLDPPPGCAFHTRCPLAKDICRRERPELKTLSTGQQAACHLVD